MQALNDHREAKIGWCHSRHIEKGRTCDLGFDIPEGKETARQAVMLNRVEEELPSTSDIAKAENTMLKEIMENAAKSMKNLIVQLEGKSSEDLPMHKLPGLNKQLRSIRGALKIEMVKTVKLEQHLMREECKFEEIRNIPDYNDDMREDFWKQIAELNNELKVRQESIHLRKGRLTNQITSFKEMIAKVLDKDISLPEKIKTLFQEQGIMICFHSHSYWNGYWRSGRSFAYWWCWCNWRHRLASAKGRKRCKRVDKKQTQSLGIPFGKIKSKSS